MPAETKKRRGRPKRPYRARTNAVHITLYDTHGGVLPKEAIDEFEVAAGSIALKYNLLSARADT